MLLIIIKLFQTNSRSISVLWVFSNGVLSPLADDLIDELKLQILCVV